jgi:hypothetical protein
MSYFVWYVKQNLSAHSLYKLDFETPLRRFNNDYSNLFTFFKNLLLAYLLFIIFELYKYLKTVFAELLQVEKTTD